MSDKTDSKGTEAEERFKQDERPEEDAGDSEIPPPEADSAAASHDAELDAETNPDPFVESSGGGAGGTGAAHRRSLSRLPMSVLTQIFTWVGDARTALPAFSATCKQFSRIAHRSPRMHIVGLKGERPIEAFVAGCDDRAEYLRHLSFDKCIVPAVDLVSIIRTCTRLQSLSLSHWSGNSSEEASFAFLYGDASISGAKDVAPLAPSLTEVSVLCPPDIHCISYLTAGAPKLASLSLVRHSDFSQADVEQLEPTMPHLRSLDFRGCQGIVDLSLTFLSTRCTHLQHLDLRGIGRVFDVGMQAVAAHMKQLRTLKLTRCKGLTDACLNGLAYRLPNLQELACPPTTTNEGVMSLLMKPEEVKDDEADVAAIVCLDLTSTTVSNSLLKSLARSFRFLRKLDLTWCGGISDAALVDLNPLDFLNELVVSRCSRVAEWGVIDLIKTSPCIRTINVHETRCNVDKCRAAATKAADELHPGVICQIMNNKA